MYGRHYRGGHIGFEPLARGGVPASGIYRVRVKAAAVDRVHPYGDVIDDFRNGDPLVMELVAVDREAALQVKCFRGAFLGASRIDERKTGVVRMGSLLRGRFQPEVRFRNGTLATKRLLRLLSKRQGTVMR